MICQQKLVQATRKKCASPAVMGDGPDGRKCHIWDKTGKIDFSSSFKNFAKFWLSSAAFQTACGRGREISTIRTQHGPKLEGL